MPFRIQVVHNVALPQALDESDGFVDVAQEVITGRLGKDPGAIKGFRALEAPRGRHGLPMSPPTHWRGPDRDGHA